MAATLLSQNHLPQVASVVLAVVRADGCTLCEAMVWLAGLAEAEAFAPILYRLPGSARGKIHHATRDESTALWRSLAARAQDTSIDADPKMPSAASTWRLHLSGIRSLADSDAVSAACRAELLKLVVRRTTPAQREIEGESMPAAEAGRADPDGQDVVPTPATHAEPVTVEVEPAPATGAETTPSLAADRGRRLKRATLITETRTRWGSIESDLHDAATNGLSADARDKGGFWWEGSAQAWATARGKLKGAAEAVLIHRIQG